MTFFIGDRHFEELYNSLGIVEGCIDDEEKMRRCNDCKSQLDCEFSPFRKGED